MIIWLWAGLIAFGTVLISLYTGWWVWLFVLVWAVSTVVMTFVVPRLQRPGDVLPPA
jgi:UDP-GlcNAc:undecaprenyl-phosphate GlcNAc-1-phosphate transferase